MERISGTVYFKIDSVLHQAVGAFTYGLGTKKREAKMSTTGVAGFGETHQAAFIEGEIYDSGELDLRALTEITNATVTLELANGKAVILHQSFFAGDGTGNSEEGKIPVRFEAASGEEIR